MQPTKPPTIGVPAFRQTGPLAEKRLRFTVEAGKKLEVAAQIRGMTPSEFVEWALQPHLDLNLPELPRVLLKATFTGKGA